MAGANFLFPSTLGKVETRTLGWSVIWDFTVERVLKERVTPPQGVVAVPTQITDFFLIPTFNDIQLFIPMSTFTLLVSLHISCRWQHLGF